MSYQNQTFTESFWIIFIKTRKLYSITIIKTIEFSAQSVFLSQSHSLLTELLFAGYSVLGDVYKMLMLKIQPRKHYYHTCYFMDRNPATNRKFVQ